MLNRKGQGLTEYGIILLLILGVGMSVWSAGIGGNVTELYSTIGNKLFNFVEHNFDLTGEENKVSQKGRYVNGKYVDTGNRGSPAYKTSLFFTDKNGTKYRISYRNEGGTRNNNGIFEKFQHKVYTLTLDDAQNQVYHGSDGLMTKRFAAKLKDVSYEKYGYTTGSDSNGNYKATYFNIDGQTYVIRDYGDTNTVLTNYVGDTHATVTNAYDNSSSTVAALAETRTSNILEESN